MQIGTSLYPVVSDYFSWSHEVPLGKAELPVVGEFYTYRRPNPDYRKMSPWQRATVWLYETFSGGRTATKQCHSVDPTTRTWDTGSDDKIRPVSEIVGHVTEIYDSRQRELSKTQEGRMRLWVERHHLRGDYAWLKSSQYMAIQSKQGTQIYDSVGNPIRLFAGWSLKTTGTKFLLLKRNDQWRITLLAYWPETGRILSPCDANGQQLPSLNPHYQGNGFTVSGRLALLFMGQRWMVDPTGPHIQTSTLTFGSPFTGKIVMSGGGEADVFVKVLVDGKECTPMYGVWAQEIPLTRVHKVEIEASRHAENYWSSGGIDKFTLK